MMHEIATTVWWLYNLLKIFRACKFYAQRIHWSKVKNFFLQQLTEWIRNEYFIGQVVINCNYIDFITKLTWPGNREGAFRCSSRAAPVHLTATLGGSFSLPFFMLNNVIFCKFSYSAADLTGATISYCVITKTNQYYY